jgi:hypothetical protein
VVQLFDGLPEYTALAYPLLPVIEAIQLITRVNVVILQLGDVLSRLFPDI